MLPGVIVEDHRRKHVAVLGDRDRRHLQRRRLLKQLIDAARAVKEGELRMKVKMNKLRHQIEP